MEALNLLPDPDCSIWSDGSPRGGTACGGGGPLIILHREQDRQIECKVAAGSICSSMRTNLTAIREALKTVSELPASSLIMIQVVRLCTDSHSGLQRLNSGPLDQDQKLHMEVVARPEPLVSTRSVS